MAGWDTIQSGRQYKQHQELTVCTHTAPLPSCLDKLFRPRCPHSSSLKRGERIGCWVRAVPATYCLSLSILWRKNHFSKTQRISKRRKCIWHTFEGWKELKTWRCWKKQFTYKLKQHQTNKRHQSHKGSRYTSAAVLCSKQLLIKYSCGVLKM